MTSKTEAHTDAEADPGIALVNNGSSRGRPHGQPVEHRDSRSEHTVRPPLSRGVVAIVDDDPRMLESLAELLESAGHAVRLYSSPRMLLEDGDLAAIDCLISDICMPDMDGLVLRRLARAERPELPVILITGRPEMKNSDLAITLDRDYFEKPFDGQKLLAAVRSALVETRSRTREDREP
jgi:FixJ family two-component response regulator